MFVELWKNPMKKSGLENALLNFVENCGALW